MGKPHTHNTDMGTSKHIKAQAWTHVNVCIYRLVARM